MAEAADPRIATMGFEVVAIARGEEKGPLAKEFGAHHYIDSTASDVADELTKLGGAQVVLATVTVPDAMTPALGGIAALTGVRPTIETLPLVEAQAAYDKMISGDARFRMALTMG